MFISADLLYRRKSGICNLLGARPRPLNLGQSRLAPLCFRLGKRRKGTECAFFRRGCFLRARGASVLFGRPAAFLTVLLIGLDLVVMAGAYFSALLGFLGRRLRR